MSNRIYLSIVAEADDVETLHEWARVQTAMHRHDPDVIDIDARLVVEDADGNLDARLIEFAELTS